MPVVAAGDSPVVWSMAAADTAMQALLASRGTTGIDIVHVPPGGWVSGPFYLGAYWGDRCEPPAACADRSARMLTGLAAVSELLGAWRRKGRSPGAASRAPVPVDAASLLGLLEDGVSRGDADGRVLADLGSSLALWNGRSDVPVGLAVRCGLRAGSLGLVNSVVLDLPPELLAVADRLLGVVVEAWEPESATVTSAELLAAQTPAPRGPVVGWLTWLPVPRVPAGVDVLVEPLAGGSLLRLAGPAEQVPPAAAADLAAALRSAGVLRPALLAGPGR